MKKTALLFLGCVFIFSCRNATTIPIIDLNRVEQSISLDITDILKDISVVQISEDFLLSTSDQIYVTSQYLVIYTNQSLHLFSREGEHIRKLAEAGRGPGEFNLIQKFFVDEDEHILYYIDDTHPRLNRMDIRNRETLEPLQVDLRFVTADYMNGRIYGLPRFRYAGRSFTGGPFPDSGIVAHSISLPSGEMEEYRGHYSYSFLNTGATITSYRDEIVLLNYDYSDTLFTFKNNQLSPLYVLRLSNKMKHAADGGNGCRIISAYNAGIVFSKDRLEYSGTPPRVGPYIAERVFFALYDRKGNVFKIDSINVMGAQINFADFENPWRLSSLLPVTCDKYGYMVVEHDFFETRPAHLEPDNDNPIIIVGELR
ncbi:MAG: 6-bladed beta-propeller [Bacteroidales bacterium]|nr:6-bladed beta-propeller [Bacteroidales bacterium]